MHETQPVIQPTPAAPERSPEARPGGERTHSPAHDPRTLSPAAVLRLQRTIGNRAVGQLLQAARPKPRQIQRTVAVASADLEGEINGLINGAFNNNTPALIIQAYTLLQHIDWAVGLGGGDLRPGIDADFSTATSPLVIVQHGMPGSVGDYKAGDIVKRLNAVNTGLPADWKGTIYITSCHSGVKSGQANESVAEAVEAGVKTGNRDVKVQGFEGETVTHGTFGKQIFVVSDAAAWAKIQQKYQGDPNNVNLLLRWGGEVAKKKVSLKDAAAVRQSAADVAKLTEQIYQGMMQDAVNDKAVKSYQLA